MNKIMFGGEEYTIGLCFKCKKPAKRSLIQRLISLIRRNKGVYLGEIICRKCFNEL